MPSSSDDTSDDNEEPEQSKISDDLCKNVNDYSNTKKNNEDVDIDNI